MARTWAILLNVGYMPLHGIIMLIKIMKPLTGKGSYTKQLRVLHLVTHQYFSRKRLFYLSFELYFRKFSSSISLLNVFSNLEQRYWFLLYSFLCNFLRRILQFTAFLDISYGGFSCRRASLEKVQLSPGSVSLFQIWKKKHSAELWSLYISWNII